MKTKDKTPSKSIGEVKHFTSGSVRGGSKGIVVESVRPGSETARFMERMEIQRLRRQCFEPIDLRGKVSGTVRAYYYANMTHWLDEASHRIFRQALADNRGVFTVGAFETIVGGRYVVKTPKAPSAKSNPAAPAPRKPTPSTEQKPQAPGMPATPVNVPQKDHHEYFKRPNPDIVPFGYFRKRREDRYLHALAVELTLNAQAFSGQTIDFSFHGLQLVFDASVHLAPGEAVEILFKLGGPDAGDPLPCCYRVISVRTEKRETIAALELDEDDSGERYGRIKSFFERIARRAKIDPLDELTTTRSLAYQHFYSASLAHIPMFFRIDSEGRPWIETIGRTPSNEYIFEFFGKENGEHDFSPLRLPARISHLCLNVAAARFSYDASMPDDRPIGELNLLVFKDIHGNLHSVAEHETASPADWEKLLRYAFVNKEHRVFKLLVSYIREHNHDKAVRSTVNLAKRDLDAAKTIVSAFRGFIAVGQLSDITQEQKTWLRNTLDPSGSKLDITGLHTWVGDSQLDLAEPTAPPLHSDPLLAAPTLCSLGDFISRREERYVARTKAEIEIDGVRYNATTRDLSVRGLSLYIDEQPTLSRGQSVTVGLLSFGRKSYNFDLRNMPYRIVDFSRESPCLIRLEREKCNHWDDITEFFKEIIDLNHDKLKPCLEDVESTARTRLFEDVYSSHIPTIPFFLSRDAQGKLRIVRIVVSEFTSELADFFYLDKNFLDYRALNESGILKSFEKALTGGKPSQHTLYFYKEDDKESAKTVIKSACDGSLGDHEAQVAYIRTAFSCGEYRFMSVRLAPLNKPKAQLLNPLLDTLREKAAAECTALENELASVIAFGEMLDVTRDIRSAILG